MKITIVGSGYVGLVTGACLAEMGNELTMLDNDASKIAALKRGEVPIYEPGLSELILKNAANIIFTSDSKKAYENAQIIFIAVGTPMGADGAADLSAVFAVAKDIAKHIKNYVVVVNKSTMPVGSAKKVASLIKANLTHKEAKFDIISNPEFLKEGVAIKDFMSPDRVVLGGKNKKALEIMRELYLPFTLKNERIIFMSNESAEMTKYAANAMLATKISFINEMSQICEKNGANINDVRVGIGSDTRIGYSFIYPGCGYGGSCFPKDVSALRFHAREMGVKTRILEAIERVNEVQKELIAKKVLAKFGANLSGKSFGIWGLAFKPETDDIREASALKVVQILLENGAKINAYDPKASANFSKIFPENKFKISYKADKYEALKDAEALILLTEWKEFRTPNFAKIASLLKNRIIFDGRNIYKDTNLSDFEYHFVGGSEKFCEN